MQIDFDPNVDYYKALGVSSTATLDEIKKAYRKLAKQNHPDSTGGDKAKEARFKEIGAAYDVLGDAKKRKQYDEIRAMGGMRGRGAGPGGMSGFPGGMGGMGGMSAAGGHGQAWDLGDLFAQMFSQQTGGPGGGRRSVRFERGDDDDNGWVFETRQGGRPPSQSDAFEGRTQASDGSWLTVKGKDVHSDVHIPFGDAILGTVAEVATLDGKSSVKIPPGTGSGKKLRLRGKGVLTGDGAAGDHYVTVQIDVPASLDDKAKKLLVELTTHLASTSGSGSGSGGSRRK